MTLVSMKKVILLKSILDNVAMVSSLIVKIVIPFMSNPLLSYPGQVSSNATSRLS